MDVKNEIKSLRLLDVDQHIADIIERSEISKEAINLYNKALEKAKRDGEDIAIIELKRALSHNENFVEALTLLGYCYLVTDNRAEAKKYLFRATQLSEYGIRAYMILHGMGILDMPQEKITKNNLDKHNRGIQLLNIFKKKIIINDNDEEKSGVHIHSVGFAGNRRKELIIPILLAIAIIFVLLMYLLFLR